MGFFEVNENTSQTSQPSAEGEHCVYPQPATEISDWEQMTLSGGDELQRVLRWLAKKFSRFSLKHLNLDANERSLIEEINFYKSLKPSDAGTFFQPPAELPQMCISKPYRLSEGEIVDLTFGSHFEPYYKPFRNEFDSYIENRTVSARMWRHSPGKSKGTIIAVHGWLMGDKRLNALTLFPGFFYRLGLDVVLYELPHHGSRAPSKGDDSSSLFPSVHVARTNEGIAQAIYDLRSLRAWLKQQNNQPVGVIGLSLGGYTAALWAGLDKLDFAIVVSPLTSLAGMAYRLLENQKHELDGFTNYQLCWHFSLQELTEIYSMHSPLNYEPKVPADRLMILAGKSDSILPPGEIEALAAHWNSPKLHWFDRGHVDQLSEADAFQKVHEFLLAFGAANPELSEITVPTA